MINIKNKIAQVLLDRVKEACPDAELDLQDVVSWLEYPPDVNMGDLAFPCFKLSKLMRRSPVQIASALAENVVDLCDCVASAENVNGYLNMKIKGEYLVNAVLPEILTKGDAYGAPDFGKGKTVVLDYSSPNLAKPFHVGHLGTTVIGHSLKKLHEFAGYKCVGINYVGDWGTQFGKLIVAYKKWGDRKTVEEGGVDALVDLYVCINNAISGNEEMGIVADPSLATEARAEFLKMEQGDEENLALWKWLVQMSLNAN
jgi:arginyl-tRNA synthetase